MNGQDQVQFEHLSLSHGLSNPRVNSIAQDSTGYIWIGTENGLNRYDGNEFKVYHKGNCNISSNDIFTLYLDSKKRLWIGTIGGGINRYNPINDDFVTFKESTNTGSYNKISFKDVYTIIEDKKGTIWIGTENGLNVFREDTSSFKSYIPPPSESNSSIQGILELENGHFLIGTYGNGLNLFDSAHKKFSKPDFAKKGMDMGAIDFINCLLLNKKNEILIGTQGKGLVKLNIKEGTISNYLKGTKYEEVDIVRSLYKDKQGHLWVGTDGYGILKINILDKTPIVDQYTHDNRLSQSLTNNTVNCFYQDNQSNIWLGTAWKGINIIENTTKNVHFYYSDLEGYNASAVLSVFKKDNRLYIGTDGSGLSIYNESSKDVDIFSKRLSTSIGGEYIQKIVSGKNNHFWIGTFANGLIQWDPKKGPIRQYQRNPNNKSSLPYNDVRDIVQLPSGDLWVGTWGGGLSYFDSKKKEFKNLKHDKNNPNSISSNNVLSLLPEKEGKLWIATFGGGLNLFDPSTGQFTCFQADGNAPESLGNNYIYSLLKDDIGNLWLGTRDGLYKFHLETQKFKRFDIGNTSNSNIVVGLLKDYKGHIWISTKEGLFKYDFHSNSIQPLPEINEDFHINSSFKDSDGTLYFGGAKGVFFFNPKDINATEKNLPVIFTDFKLFNKSVQIGQNKLLKTHISQAKNIGLKHDENIFTFNFTLLKYPISKGHLFAVKMEGFEKEWRIIGAQRNATYTNLSPGDYVFKVKSLTSNEDVLNESMVTSMPITILPPFWKTWWAYIIYAITSIGILIGIQYYFYQWVKIKNKLKLETIHRIQEDRLHSLKQRFFTNISHEIRTPLTLILNPLNNLLEKGKLKANEQKQLLSIKRNTDRLLGLVNELLNFRQLETGNIKLKVAESNIVTFTNEIFLAFNQQSEIKNIDYTFTAPTESILVWFDKFQLEKVIYNLLSNAFKFTKKGDSIDVSINKDCDHVHISVKDTGSGISNERLPNIFERFYQSDKNASDDIGFGIGLSIVRDIVKLHSGSVEVESSLNKGSTFVIKIPLDKDHFSASGLSTDILLDEEDVKSYKSTRLEPIPNRNGISEEPGMDEGLTEKMILLVEDNIDLQHYLTDMLSSSYKVITASNGEEGLELAIEHIPDLVISDIMMPVMDGIAFCHKLKTDFRISHIPVILLTARTLAADKIKGYNTGADDYLIKPFNEKMLNARIKNLLANREMLRNRFLKEGMLHPRDIALNSPDEKFLVDFIKIIEKNIEESDFNMDQLSKKLAMSHSNVYKKVKALTGMTIRDFIKDFRLKKAANLLKHNKFSVFDVCLKVGYTNRRHFSREFKKVFGISPTEYTKRHIEKTSEYLGA
ncbi:MAG: two-component regulator propeller domain-containing protein [Flavobacteriaceae bacterium]